MRRPGEMRLTLISALQGGPAHPAAIADRWGLDVGHVRKTLANMCSAAEAMVVGDERVPGSNRPARVYSLVGETPVDDGHNWDLIKCWSAWPADL